MRQVWLERALLLCLLSAHLAASAEQLAMHAHTPALYSIIPFVLLLLAIAVLPLIRATEHWWEGNWNHRGPGVPRPAAIVMRTVIRLP